MGDQLADPQISKCTLMSFKTSAVIISGGSKGIGLSIARVFARETDRPLVLLARNEEQLAIAKQQCLDEGASNVYTIAVDLTDAAAVNALKLPEGIEPGILVNNTGSFLFKNLQDTTSEEFDRQYQLNTVTAFNLTSRMLPEIAKQDRGLVVNICSRASLYGYGASGAYAMSKHALLGYTRSLREELKGTSIAVTALNLGQTYSTSWEGSDVDPKKLIHPEDVGHLIVGISKLSPQSVVEELVLMPQDGEI